MLDRLDNIFNKYNLDFKDQKYLIKIIKPIINHSEFQKRMTKEFMHHADITLGEHIIEDTVSAFLMAKNKNRININLVVKIAMLHDLYTIPWQNNPSAKVHHFFNKHGFRHPIEATINAITWYPEIFKDTLDAEIIIDGILHHMFPLPVRRIDNESIIKAELKNIDNYNNLAIEYQKMIISSLNRGKIGILSFARSKYKEGKIMAKADRKVSFRQIKNFPSFISLFTGHNSSLKK